MKHAGTQLHPRVLVPKLYNIERTVSLSKDAKQRLKWIDYYQAHGSNARLTCRHYGIAHRTFYRYHQRFKLQGLRGLEARSHRPARVRQPLTPLPVVDLVRRLRKANPELSKYKLAVILKRDYGYSLSASSVGRVISRYRLFFTPPVKPKNHPARRTNLKRIRKPAHYRVSRPGDLIEVDVKYLPSLEGHRRYAFTAIDVISKQATVHVASTNSSLQGALAWRKTVHRLGLPKAVLTDNGSENAGAFAELLESQSTDHYFARPYMPKDKPHVERFIGILERECLQWGHIGLDVAEQQALTDQWLEKYHRYRPHQALGYLTPDEFVTKLKAEEMALMQ